MDRKSHYLRLITRDNKILTSARRYNDVFNVINAHLLFLTEQSLSNFFANIL